MRTFPSSGPVPQLELSPAAATWRSTPSVSRDAPTSPMPDETSTATTTLSRSTHLTRNSQTEQNHNAGALDSSRIGEAALGLLGAPAHGGRLGKKGPCRATER